MDLVEARARYKMSRYDEEFARQVKRRRIARSWHSPDDLVCHLCTSNEMNTASEYEYPCLILKDWICETHCAEITLARSKDTRFGPELHPMQNLAYQELVGKPLEAGGEKDGYNRIMEVCSRCPYHGVDE